MFNERNEGLLASAVATVHDRRRALLVMAVLVVAFAVTAPLAQWRVPTLPQFVPLYDVAIAVLDTLAAVLLYAQFEHLRRRSLLVLACAYVFTPIVVTAHALSVPNAIVPGTVIGGEQSAAWLWVAWHGIFPIFIAAYALMGCADGPQTAVADRSMRVSGLIGLLVTVALALGAVAVIVTGDGAVPVLMRGDMQSSGLTTIVLGSTFILHVAALGALAWCTRLRRVIDAWLAVTLVALAIEVLLSGVLIASRDELGYYVGRVYGLLAALFVLGVLLHETVTLSAMATRFLDLERSARLDAESAGRAKDQFLAMLGHELRNPLSPIVTAVQLMRLRGVEAPELPILERQVAHLTQLVDDLLDVSRITKGKIALHKRRLELSEAVLRGVEIASPALEQKSQRLDIAVEPSGLTVEADPGRLAQVVANLLTNASKYSDAGKRIDVRAQREGDRVRLSVKDDGLGIVPEMLDRIFDAFTQQNQTLARSEGGLGLGLTIVRTLVGLHGGKVSARSDGPGRGSEFIVELPLVEARPKTNRPVDDARKAAAASDRILVVDDNVDAALSLAALLRALGHEVETAHDAPGAIAVAETFRPQVALLDIGLPVMDGYDLARELRAVSGDRPLHLVAVTGYGLEPDRQRSRDAGFVEHLVKPVDRKELQALLERLQARSGRAPRQGLSRNEAAGATRASD